jgi:phasin family protein
MNMSKTQTQTKTGNPFIDGDFGAMMDFTKVTEQFTEQFKVPGVDTKALAESQKRNMETLAEINRVAFDGARAIMQRQAEIMRQAMEEATKAVRDMSKPGKPEEAMAKQAEMAKHVYEQCLANARELAEMGTKSNSKAAELFTHRVTDGLEELKGAFKHTNGAKK